MRLNHIRDMISMFVYHTSPLNGSFIKEKVNKYINEMKEMLLDCEACQSSAGGSCQNCVKIQETIGWALEKLRDVEKQ